MGAMSFGLAAGALGALSGFSAEKQRLDSRAQAAFMESQAASTRKRGEMEAQRAGMEAAAIDRRKSALRRQYKETQGQNRSVLAAGNVDLASGSAADMQQGNMDLFASDLGENAYEKAIRLWEGENARIASQNEAANMEANASYIKRAAGSIGTSILSGALGGFEGFTRGYTLAGGKLGRLFSGGK